HIASELSNYNIFFAYNFIAKWMQIPLLHPMGNVNSGLLVASEHTFLSSKRIQLETMNTLPKRLFSPKECMVISRFEIPPFELILINVYLMPYTPIDTIRLHQLETIMNHAAMLYDPLKNYVIVAGDFHYQLDGKSTPEHPPFPTDKVPEGFTLVYDHDNASVRSMNHPYIKDMNYEYIVDGFIVSKNLHHTKIKTVDLGFEHANHNPVTLEIEIK
ncbi:MAG: hypothetical protein K9L26_00705, partial [Candidatus Izimaplasma sp.]|nr:hypothetical protein [Candidatus Izimaplasma bacterium]